MSDLPGFARAQRQWENMEPSHDGCPCVEDPTFGCRNCGLITLEGKVGQPCPECVKDSDPLHEDCYLYQLDDQELIEDHPSSSCRHHGDNEPDPDEARDRMLEERWA